MYPVDVFITILLCKKYSKEKKVDATSYVHFIADKTGENTSNQEYLSQQNGTFYFKEEKNNISFKTA